MPDHQPTASRWRRRPGLARLYRAYVFTGPLVTLVAVAFFCIQLLPTTGSALEAVVRWLLIAALSLGAAWLTERALQGLLVVAALLDLDLGFPGAVPTRTRIASQASLPGDGRDCARRSPAVARGELDAAAEHAVTRYGAMTGDRLWPRTHLSRVRAVAALMAVESRLPIGDRDRLEWALLLREIGTPADDSAHVHRPVVDWLGPWSALVQGPFIVTAIRTSSPRVAWAAHVAAVADAYVVLTAAHPYERSLAGGSRLPFDALAAQRLSARAVEALLAVPVPARRRAAGFTSGVASSIVHRSPRRRLGFTLASPPVPASEPTP